MNRVNCCITGCITGDGVDEDECGGYAGCDRTETVCLVHLCCSVELCGLVQHQAQASNIWSQYCP
jgi:hypothetical protein